MNSTTAVMSAAGLTITYTLEPIIQLVAAVKSNGRTVHQAVSDRNFRLEGTELFPK